jgi:hypothetical protein
MLLHVLDLSFEATGQRQIVGILASEIPATRGSGGEHERRRQTSMFPSERSNPRVLLGQL